MKQLLLFLITFYKRFVSHLLRQLFGMQHICRYSLSCSSFAHEAIEQHGAFYGGMMTVKRIFTCHPFAKPYESL